jgi:metal-responsive CopG/Arc/MetJ family transcriptional regulator
MDTARLSITIPKEIYQEMKILSSQRKIRLSRLITEAVSEKLRRIRQEEFVRKVNQAFSDPDIADEQHFMAELIADNTDLKELPW